MPERAVALLPQIQELQANLKMAVFKFQPLKLHVHQYIQQLVNPFAFRQGEVIYHKLFLASIIFLSGHLLLTSYLLSLVNH